MVLLVLGCVLAPLAVGAAWARNLVVDQQAYVEAVGPLAEDPVIIAAAEERAVTAIDDGITSLNLAGPARRGADPARPAAEAGRAGRDPRAQRFAIS